MAFLNRIRNQYISWSRSIPFPAAAVDSTPTFQSWHEFDALTNQWTAVPNADLVPSSASEAQKPEDVHASNLTLVTWNVDATSEMPAARIAAIISHISSLASSVDVIFFQEVSRAALAWLLNSLQIRELWLSSEADETNWQGQSFATMTLVSKSRFRGRTAASGLGPIWRLKYPSRFGRDALCCDVFVPAPPSLGPAAHARVRLVNVHLDSLPIQPSQRPRQISIVSSVLRSVGRGVVAGDFNPVLPEDAELIQKHHLVDAWLELQPDDPGFTWGADYEQPFPPPIA